MKISEKGSMFPRFMIMSVWSDLGVLLVAGLAIAGQATEEWKWLSVVAIVLGLFIKPSARWSGSKRHIFPKRYARYNALFQQRYDSAPKESKPSC